MDSAFYEIARPLPQPEVPKSELERTARPQHGPSGEISPVLTDDLPGPIPPKKSVQSVRTVKKEEAA